MFAVSANQQINTPYFTTISTTHVYMIKFRRHWFEPTASIMTLPGADEVQLRARYLGTGNADTTTKHVFLTNQHRDTAASIISHTSSQCAYYAVAQNESIHRTKYNLLESMIQPCGIPPHLQQQHKQASSATNATNGISLQPSSTTP